MKLKYKVEIHKRKGKKNETHIKYHWKNSNKDEYGVAQITYCCDEMDKAFRRGFIGVEVDQRNMAGIKHDEKYINLKCPLICLNTMNENGYGDEGCPHEEEVTSISNCPFCAERVEYECVEKKKITHECIKKSRVVEECEDKVTEEIIS